MENNVNVAHYVSELLFQHDCVVVPGFGAFVSTYASAKIHPAQHTFTPPSKQIIFNKYIQQNDGLLANTIATAVPCSFDEAMKEISSFAAEINKDLKAGKKIELHNLGMLSLDPEKNMVFEPFPEINFLVDSFGLSSFQSMPVLKEAIEEKKKVIEKAIDRPVAEELAESKPIRRRRRTTLITAAIVIPAIAAAVFFTAQNSDNIASFLPFGKKEPSKFQPVKWFVKNPADTMRTITELKTDPDGIGSVSIVPNAPPVIVNIHKVMPDTTRVADHTSPLHSPYAGDKYYVIGGCFGVKENADRFIRSLKEKGYDPRVIDQVRSRLTHIGIASFNSKEEAIQFLSKISTDVPGAWILKK